MGCAAIIPERSGQVGGGVVPVGGSLCAHRGSAEPPSRDIVAGESTTSRNAPEAQRRTRWRIAS